MSIRQRAGAGHDELLRRAPLLSATGAELARQRASDLSLAARWVASWVIVTLAILGIWVRRLR